ncbi:hypothetical protein EYF80_054070 [Liparis tanakae]|uniref:Uncharacterized protein n=1 Tax=Liparis tanakae TaxID=230148 RepID=A0A4Z2F4E9_9TELE|nr:hypothetical protein EYF80_054070 [Liparis tanakae]
MLISSVVVSLCTDTGTGTPSSSTSSSSSSSSNPSNFDPEPYLKRDLLYFFLVMDTGGILE